MNYEVVNLKEKKVVGISTKTNNNDDDMTMKIGQLWQDFYMQGICMNIKNKVNEKAVGIYSDYEGDDKSGYIVTVGTEVNNTNDIPNNTIIKIIPAGKYAKFVVKGHMQKAVAEFWTMLWNMDIDRNYICDFEEYQNADIENAEIHIFISIN